MRATDFEFKNRFWIIGGIFFVSFFAYNFDSKNVGEALVSRLMQGADLSGPAAQHLLQAVYAFGALLVIAAAALRTWAAAYIRSDVVHDSSLRTEKLVAGGPYRRVRNPLYLGTGLMTVGIGLMASRTGFFMLVLGVSFLNLRLLLREEKELLERQGEAYRAYCAAVPRLLPALRPRVPASGDGPRWKQAFLGESFFWVLAAVSVAFAVTLRANLMFTLVGIAALVYGLALVVLQRFREDE